MGKSFAQTLLGAMRDVLDGTLELLGDPDARGGAGLNPDGTPNSATAKASIDRISDYFNSDNPSGQQYLTVVNDVIAARDAIKDLIDEVRFNDDLSGDIAEYLRFLLEIAALDVVRGKFPYIYYLARLLAFVDETGAIQTVHRLQLDRLDRLFSGTPGVTYYKDVLAALPNQQARVDFTLGAAAAVLKALSFVPIIGRHLSISVFYGWDSLPGPGSPADTSLERTLTVAFSPPIINDCSNNTFQTCQPDPAPGVAFGGALVFNVIVASADSGLAETGVLATAELDTKFTIDIPRNGSKTPRGQIIIDTSGAGRLNVFVGDSVKIVGGVAGALPTLSVEYKPQTDPSDEPNFLIGSDKGTRIEFGRLGARAELRPESGGATYSVRLSLDDGALVIVPGEGDGFLNTILRALTTGGELKVAFALAIGIAKGLGLFIEGGTGLRVVLAIGKQLGPVRLESIVLAINAKTGDDKKFTLSAEVGATLSFRTTGVAVTVDQMGLKWALVPFGHMGFQPPKGLGISIDLGPVSGGGYLFFDADNKQYAGAVHLAIADLFAINGVGLVQSYTKPDGTQAYSFVIILSVEFPGGIQLGFGFTLNGVGGLFGQNRGVSTDALQQGIKTGALDVVLFPQNPVANASRIISVLSSVFPVTDGQTILGPMLKLGWGEPTFIEVSLGLIFEFEAPHRLVLLGKAVANFPDKDHAKLHLELDCVGIFNLSTGESSFDASLYRSTLGPYTLMGDIAWRSAGSGRPFWILAVGGTNPHFDVPKGLLPPMNKVGINLVTGDNPRAWLAGYTAITSNTFQIGGAVDASYSKAGFTLAAHIGADALINTSNFKFIVDFSLSVSLKRGSSNIASLGLSGTITGPKPLHFDGTASLDLFFFSIDFHVSFTIGSEDPAPLPAFSVIDPLLAALQDPRNWSGALPDSEALLVGLTKATNAPPDPNADPNAPPDPSADIIVHPIGQLVVRERVAPLGLQLQKFGAGTISGDSQFTLDGATLGTTGASVQTSDAVDFFAAGDFLELTDAQKLSRPAFENMKSGLVFSSDQPRTGEALPSPLAYKTIVRRKDTAPQSAAALYAPTNEKFLAAVKLGAAALSPLRNSGLRRFTGPVDQRHTVSDPRYTVVSSTNLTQPAGLSVEVKAGTTYAAAAQALGQAGGGAFHVAPLHEVQT